MDPYSLRHKQHYSNGLPDLAASEGSSPRQISHTLRTCDQLTSTLTYHSLPASPHCCRGSSAVLSDSWASENGTPNFPLPETSSSASSSRQCTHHSSGNSTLKHQQHWLSQVSSDAGNSPFMQEKTWTPASISRGTASNLYHPSNSLPTQFLPCRPLRQIHFGKESQYSLQPPQEPARVQYALSNPYSSMPTSRQSPPCSSRMTNHLCHAPRSSPRSSPALQMRVSTRQGSPVTASAGVLLLQQRL